MSPPVDTALSTAPQPYGAKPPALDVMLLPWKPETNRAMIVIVGTMNFSHVIARLSPATSLMPYQLTKTSTASSAAATPMPRTESDEPL
jgi:hypothetical protein